MKRFLLIVLVLILTWGCNKDELPIPPTAYFTIEPVQAKVDIPIYFDATLSEHAVCYDWDFDGGVVQYYTTVYPTVWHSYDNPGTYIVTLQVRNEDGWNDKTTRYVIVSK